ncbi:type II toxin-antitoxin system VapC family toxin [soil metagenome]
MDTHTYVWAVTAPQRLSTEARAALTNPANTLLLSAATLWEMAIRHRAGRWPEAESLLFQHDDLRARLGASDLPITAADAIRAGGLSWAHRDPFDRMLAAQALLSQATLVTRDVVFSELLGLPTLW